MRSVPQYPQPKETETQEPSSLSSLIPATHFRGSEPFLPLCRVKATRNCLYVGPEEKTAEFSVLYCPRQGSGDTAEEQVERQKD